MANYAKDMMPVNSNRYYSDFIDEARKAGKYEEFSEYDKALAAKYPEAGFSILANKINYGKAKTDEERAMYNERANQIRQAYGEYKADETGSGWSSTRLTPGQFKSGYEDQINALIGAMGENLQNREASPYSEDMKNTYDKIKGYNMQEYMNSPEYAALKQKYEAAGHDAMQDTLGEMSARTGGLASSYAGSAASQAYNKYMGDLADKAADAYDAKRGEMRSDLNLASTMDNKYKSDQNAEVDRLKTLLGLYSDMDEKAYSRYNDETDYQLNRIDRENEQFWKNREWEDMITQRNIERTDKLNAIDREQKQKQQNDAYNLVITMLQIGQTPTASLLKAAGINSLDQATAAAAAQKSWQAKFI